MPDGTFYVTTPIYYVNDIPHIGHSYTSIACDVLARYHRLCGRDVHFLTGTDEHGIKVQRAAEANNETPIQLADRVVERSKSLWQRLNISNDDFIRTTQQRHQKVVQLVFQKLHDVGTLVLGDYSGWYCASCENFLTEDELADGNCPDCGKKAEWASEPTYFFKMSEYGGRLLAHLDQHPEFVRPQVRFNEVYRRVKEGLRDVSVTRSSLKWGVPLPFDTSHVIYVWIDALVNYISALGYPDGELYEKFWPADVHVIGKDIIWFHAVIWPCILMALDLPLPETVFAHGWWTNTGEKMSKSKGNFVDPVAMTDRYGVDAYRYFLLREMPFGQDGDFSERALIGRINNDLGNDLGNLLHRTLTMIEKYFDGSVPEPKNLASDNPRAVATSELRDQASWLSRQADGIDFMMAEVQFSRALEAIWDVVRRANRYVEETSPWALAKSDATKPELATVMYSLAEVLRIVSLWLWPFMPGKMEEMRRQLSLGPVEGLLDEKTTWGGLAAGTRVAKGEPLFPRIQE